MAWNKRNNEVFDDKVEWNMNQAFTIRLDVRCNERDIAAIEGNILKWYRTLRSIFRNIHFKMKEKGHEQLEQELIASFNAVKIKILNMRFSDATQQQNQFNNLEFDLDELDIKLNDLMHEYGFVYPEKADKTIEQYIEEDF